MNYLNLIGWAGGYAQLIMTRLSPESVDDMLSRAGAWKTLLSDQEKFQLAELAKKRKAELLQRK